MFINTSVDIFMLLTDYIDSVYGTARGNRARFLKDNPDILPQELSRWLKAGLKIRPETGEIYKPVLSRVRIPSELASFSLTTCVNVSQHWPSYRT
ncbi:hypothetical protein [Enterobacter ludwigii]